MDILVTFEALFRSMREISRGLDPRGSGSSNGYRPMTTDAGSVLMRAFQREFRGSMIEAAKLFPIPRVMAGFAGLFRGMRIGVAAGARLIGEMILAGDRRLGSRDMSRIGVVHIGQGFVTIGAQYGRMSVDENEFRLRVARQVERRGPEGFLGVAQFAPIFVGCGPEFAAVRIGVTIHADQFACLVRSFFTGRLVTQFAFQLEMFTFELERALLVRFAGE
jgi:hypothetical protein